VKCTTKVNAVDLIARSREYKSVDTYSFADVHLTQSFRADIGQGPDFRKILGRS